MYNIVIRRSDYVMGGYQDETETVGDEYVQKGDNSALLYYDRFGRADVSIGRRLFTYSG